MISADSRYPVSRPKIAAAVEKVLSSRRVASDVEVSILVCGQRKSAELARKYLRDNQAHNVLSFPLIDDLTKHAFATAKSAKGFVENPEGALVLGDIVICYPFAQDEANAENKLVNEVIEQWVAHGTLHLLGEHHE